jgi:hypothetical protein
VGNGCQNGPPSCVRAMRRGGLDPYSSIVVSNNQRGVPAIRGELKAKKRKEKCTSSDEVDPYHVRATGFQASK